MFDFFLDLSIRLAILAVLLGFARLISGAWHSFFPEDGKRIREGSRTLFSVPLGLKALLLVFALPMAALAWHALRDGLWLALLFAALASVPAFLPGAIVLDNRGIRQSKFWLIPFWTEELLWEEVDSAYEDLEHGGGRRPYKTVTVSAGPDRTVKFSWAHSDRESFLAELEQRGVPILRVREPEP